MTATKTSLWQRWQPTDAEPWNVKRVVHLHRRAGFAATWTMIQRDLTDGPDAAIDRILAGTSRGEQAIDGFESMAQVIGDAAVGSNNINRLKAWWIYRMLFTPDPLTERLTLMWHNHFATSNLKVRNVGFMRNQNEHLRKFARGPFGELLTTVVRDPAMLNWLDADANRKGNPNENLAREIMELFTLGVGNYTEHDVKAAARALTGWTVKDGRFTFDRDAHDGEKKTIFNQTREFDGDDLLRLLLQQHKTAERIAFRVCEMLLGETVVMPDAIAELADGLREHNLNVQWAVETVLRSERFFAPSNIGNRILGPVEFIVGAIQALELFDPPPSTLILAEWSAKLGQSLFYPPNVFGWPGGRAWLSSRSLIHRVNFVHTLVLGKTHNPPRPVAAKVLATKHDHDGDPIQFAAQLLLGNANNDFQGILELLASPQAQLG